MAGEARIAVNLDHDRVGPEAGALVEAERSGMVEAAGMHPETLDRPGPGQLDRPLHEEPPGSRSDRLRHHAEEGDLAFAWLAEIQLQPADVLVRTGLPQPVTLDTRHGEDGGELSLVHDQEG